MKTAMKRLLSFVLAAMMLVSVVPFQASADTTADGSDPAVIANNENSGGNQEQTTTAGPFNVKFRIATIGANGEKIGDTVEKTESLAGGTYTRADLLARGAGVTDESAYDDVIVKEAGNSTNAEITSVTIEAETTINIKLVMKRTQYDVNYQIVYLEDGDSSKPTNDATGIWQDKSVITYADVDKLVPKSGNGVTYEFMGCTVNGVNAPLDYEVKADVTMTINVGKWVEKAVTFVDAEGKDFSTIYTVKHKLPNVPSSKPTKTGYTFYKWYSNDQGFYGADVDLNNPADMYYPIFQTGKSDDGVSKLDVYVGLFGGASPKFYHLSDISTSGIPDNYSISQWIKEREDDIWSSILAKDIIKDNNYQWTDRAVYDYDSDEELIGAKDKLTSDQSVYIRLDATNLAKILLYAHSKYSVSYFDLYEFSVAPSDDVTLSQALEKVKKEYRFDSSKAVGLFDEDAWEDALDGRIKESARVHVDTAGTYEIHVVIKDATPRSGTADSSNPKTGDTILMAGGVLGVSAAALAVLYFLNKKKQVL